MYKLIKNICLSLLINLIGIGIFAQEEKPKDLGIQIPPSPTVASITKFGDIPVSLFTGTPNINIPIWEVKSGKLSVPISLSYHASGIKVQEIAGWVGLNWGLNTGGVISRTMNGKPDESYNGYMWNGDLLPDSGYTWDPEYGIAADIADGLNAIEPDIFSFNFPGYSGTFSMILLNLLQS